MPSLRFLGIPLGATVNVIATQGAAADTYSTSTWGLPPAPVNVVPPFITGSSVIGSNFDLDPGEWSGVVSSYEYRLKLDGVIQPGVTSFPEPVVEAQLGKVPTYGVRAVGPGFSSDWIEVVGPAVSYTPPTFSTQPTLSSTIISAGDILTLNLGAAGPNATLSVAVFSVAGVDKRGELTGSGATRTWDSAGEASGAIQFRVTATNASGSSLSNVVAGNLIGAGGAFYPTEVNLSAKGAWVEVIDLEALGAQDSLTIDSISAGRITRRGDGKYSLDLTDFNQPMTVTIGYTAIKSGFSNITGTCTVQVALARQEKGWGPGAHYYLPINGSNEVVVEPGINHKKVYCSTSGLDNVTIRQTLGITSQRTVQITRGSVGLIDALPNPDIVSIISVTTGSAATGDLVTYTQTTDFVKNGDAVDWSPAGAQPANGAVYSVKYNYLANPSGSFLLNNIVPPALGGNGTWKYGDDPAVALHPEAANQLWNAIFSTSAGPQSAWLLRKRGEDFTGYNFSASGRLRGESPIHPILYGTYGSGADPIITAPDGGNAGAQYVVVQNAILGEPWKHTALGALLVDGITGTGENSMASNGNNVSFSQAWTLRRAKFTDMSKSESIVANNPAKTQWEDKGDRAEAFFSSEYEANLLEDVFVDIAGWAEGYTLDFSKLNPQPPTFYSHAAYLAGLPTLEDTTGPVVNLDVTMRNSTLSRGSLTGFQYRPGGVVYSNAFIGNNIALMMGGGGKGDVLEYKNGNYAFVADNVVTYAGQKTLMKRGTMAGGINYQNLGAIGINNIICHSGAGNDGVTAHGVVTEFTTGTPWFTVNVEEGEVLYEDTKVRSWITNSADQNLGGLDLPTLDAATLENYALSWLGTPTDRRNLLLAIRNEAAPWAKVRNDILPYFQTAFQALPPAAGAPTTRVFRPTGISPGIRWDIRQDWVGGVTPKTGDSVNLAGHRVNTFENNTINALDLQGGELIQHGGRLTVTSLISGGTLTQRFAGQFFMSGYSGANLITVNSEGGRFRNNGNITQNMDFNITGLSEVLFADGTGNVTIPAGRSIVIDDSRARVGWDGTTGNTCTLTIAGSLTFKSMMTIPFVGRDVDDGEAGNRNYAATWKHGAVITGATSGFTGTVSDHLDLTISTGNIFVKDWTGVPLKGEGLVGVGKQYFRDAPFGQIALVLTPADNLAVPQTYTMPRIAEFRSGINGLTAPNINSVVALQVGSTLNLNVTGLLPGPYDLIVADSVTGTFSNVNFTGGTGTVSYTATKVILNVT